METIIKIIAGLFGLCILYGVIGALMSLFPALIGIIGIVAGIAVGVLYSSWWKGLLVGIFLIGALAHARSVAEKF